MTHGWCISLKGTPMENKSNMYIDFIEISLAFFAQEDILFLSGGIEKLQALTPREE